MCPPLVRQSGWQMEGDESQTVRAEDGEEAGEAFTSHAGVRSSLPHLLVGGHSAPRAPHVQRTPPHAIAMALAAQPSPLMCPLPRPVCSTLCGHAAQPPLATPSSLPAPVTQNIMRPRLSRALPSLMQLLQILSRR